MSKTSETIAPPFPTWAESDHAAASIVCEMLGGQAYFDAHPDYATEAIRARAWDDYLARLRAWDERKP